MKVSDMFSQFDLFYVHDKEKKLRIGNYNYPSEGLITASDFDRIANEILEKEGKDVPFHTELKRRRVTMILRDKTADSCCESLVRQAAGFWNNLSWNLPKRD